MKNTADNDLGWGAEKGDVQPRVIGALVMRFGVVETGPTTQTTTDYDMIPLKEGSYSHIWQLGVWCVFFFLFFFFINPTFWKDTHVLFLFLLVYVCMRTYTSARSQIWV